MDISNVMGGLVWLAMWLVGIGGLCLVIAGLRAMMQPGRQHNNRAINTRHPRWGSWDGQTYDRD